jgi:RNA polymerase sigma factor FliA
MAQLAGPGIRRPKSASPFREFELEWSRVTKTDDPPEVMERFQSALDLVEKLSRQLVRGVGSSVDVSELMSYGQEGLLDASRRFEADRGVPFRAYATLRVRGSIIDGMRSMARLPRRIHDRLRALEAGTRFGEGALEDASAPGAPGSTAADADRVLSEHMAGMATAMAIGLVANTAHGDEGEAVGVAHDESPEEALARAELVALVRDTIATLPHEEAELVRRHYLEGERFDHVAADLGLSKSWASRLHTRAMGRLTKRLRGATD